MTEMVVLAAERKLRESSKVLDNVDRLIEDINKASSKGQEYIRIAYSKGIIGGYPDNTFRPDGNATRAEACTILVRLLDEGTRIDVVVPEAVKKETVVYKGYEVPVSDASGMRVDWATEEEIKAGLVEVSFIIRIKTGDLEAQYEELEVALSGKFKKSTVEKVINKVKMKKDYKDEMESLYISEGNYNIRIGSEYKSSIIQVSIWQEQ